MKQVKQLIQVNQVKQVKQMNQVNQVKQVKQLVSPLTRVTPVKSLSAESLTHSLTYITSRASCDAKNRETFAKFLGLDICKVLLYGLPDDPLPSMAVSDSGVVGWQAMHFQQP